MSDVMLCGVLRMPFALAMKDEIARYQYHQRGLEAADRIEALELELAEAKAANQEALGRWMDDQIARLEAHNAAIEEGCHAIRAACSVCGGSGHAGPEEECEYCGRPIQALRFLMEARNAKAV